jgi:hypothetical protein
VDTRDTPNNREGVKIIGRQRDEHTFEAKEIRTWKNHSQESDKKESDKKSENSREKDE